MVLYAVLEFITFVGRCLATDSSLAK